VNPEIVAARMLSMHKVTGSIPAISTAFDKSFLKCIYKDSLICRHGVFRFQQGGLAQLAARMLSMHKVAGSIPAISRAFDNNSDDNGSSRFEQIAYF
jgi:hypothetical protein